MRRWLHERRLNANYYNPRDHSIWHVPGFSAFEHRCPRSRQRLAEDPIAADLIMNVSPLPGANVRA